MPKRIDSLTDAQKAQMQPWADKWIEHGLSCEPADWEAWERGARRCYAAAGIPWPNNVVRVSSPIVLGFAGPIAAAILDNKKPDGAVGVAVRGAVDGAVGVAVDGAVGVAVGGAVDGAVGVAVGVAVGDAVRDAVDVAVGDAVGGAVRDAVRGAVDGAAIKAGLQHWYRYLGGAWWGYWMAWRSYFREVGNLQLEGDLWERSQAYELTAQSAGWWWPHRQFVMVCDRPVEIHREQIGPRGWGSHQLHNESGPSISFRDGWALYHIHGRRVTEQIVMNPESLTAEQILAEPNAEVRRIMVERLGADRFVAQAKAKVRSEDTDLHGRRRRLLVVPMQGDEDIVMVEVTNSTAEPDGTYRNYMLRVPPTTKTCHEGVAWTFGVPADTYAPAYES